MLPGNIIAIVVAGLSAVGIAAAARAVTLVPKLQLPGWAGMICYVAAAAMILCLGLLLTGMTWGLLANWPEQAKWAMAVGFFMTVPAAAGAILFIGAGLAGSGAAKGYFLGLGIAGLPLFGLPALIFLVMLAPGRP